MLYVRTKVLPSRIEGIGLFADEYIKKGTLIWKFIPGFDQDFDESILEKLSEPAKEEFLKYSYINPKTGRYSLVADNARFINHSHIPTMEHVDLEEDDEGMDIAARDIMPGEELTIDYRKIHEGEEDYY